jgi:hypothetical protein
MNLANPAVSEALATFIDVLVEVGATEGPVIVAAITKAIRGEDPLEAISKERVEDIMPGSKLELAMAAERLRFAHEASGSPTP